MPAAEFRAGRGAFLRAMLARPRIFLSELFHAELDRSARGNLSRVLGRYGASSRGVRDDKLPGQARGEALVGAT